jgi:hypothetical protein
MFFVSAVVTGFLLGLSCFVLWVHYPGYLLISSADFPAYEAKHTRATAAITLPSMLLEMGLAIWAFFSMPLNLPYQLLAFLPLIGVWYTTFGLAIPCHKRLLKHGKQEAVIRKLIGVHAWRTAFWALRLAALAGLWVYQLAPA